LIEGLMAIVQQYDENELRGRLKRQVQVTEAMAVTIFHMAARALPTQPDPQRPVNPYMVSLQPERWEADGLYEGDVVLPLEAALQIAPGVQNLSLDRTPVA
jgi:hypothetical protein